MRARRPVAGPSAELSGRAVAVTALGETASAQPAAFDPRVVQLRLVDDSAVPDPGELHRWIERICGAGPVRAIRTSALFPPAADRFRAAGFAVADTLTLLRVDLTDAGVRAGLTPAPEPGPAATRRLRRRDYRAAAAVDRRAFGPEWGQDAAELHQVRDATPHWRGRVRVDRSAPPVAGDESGRPVVGFALSGASAHHGYLQRLSVDPAAQGRGHGRALTLDALRWMARRRLPDCLVNTSVDNAVALGLYQSLGFRPLTQHLEVLELDVVRAS